MQVRWCQAILDTDTQLIQKVMVPPFVGVHFQPSAKLVSALKPLWPNPNFCFLSLSLSPSLFLSRFFQLTRSKSEARSLKNSLNFVQNLVANVFTSLTCCHNVLRDSKSLLTVHFLRFSTSRLCSLAIFFFFDEIKLLLLLQRQSADLVLLFCWHQSVP